MTCWIAGQGVRIDPIGPFLVEHRGGPSNELRWHALGGGSAHLTRRGDQVMVQPFVTAADRTLRLSSPSNFLGGWCVCTASVVCSLPQGMAVFAASPTAPFELRFCAGTLPAPRLVTFGASARKSLPLGDETRFELGPDFLLFLEPVPSTAPTDAEAFATGLVTPGKTLLRTGRLERRTGDAGVVELAARDALQRPVRERWYLIPLDASRAVPLLLVAEAMTFDVAAKLADEVANSTRSATV